MGGGELLKYDILSACVAEHRFDGSSTKHHVSSWRRSSLAAEKISRNGIPGISLNDT